MLRRLVLGVVIGLGAALSGCGDGTPECKQVLSSCTESCNISCGSGEETGCVGPDFGDYDIGASQRCCICVSEDR